MTVCFVSVLTIEVELYLFTRIQIELPLIYVSNYNIAFVNSER